VFELLEDRLVPAATTVTIDQAATQVDPTNASPIHFTAVFSEPVTGFTNQGITLGGTAGATTAVVTDSGDEMTFDVAVSGMTQDGTVTAEVNAGAATGTDGPNSASTSTDNSVSFDTTAPTVTCNQAATQVDPTNSSPIRFTAVFSEPVIGFTNSSVTLGGTAGATTAVVTDSGDHMTYDVAVSGMTRDGTVTAAIAAGVAQDAAGNLNAASTSTDNSVTLDTTAPTVTINQASTQADPTNSTTIHFTAVFSEPVTGFTGTSVSLGGTAGATTAMVTDSGDHMTYDVAVSGTTQDGTVTAAIAAGVAQDAASNLNAASTSTDNSVTLDTTAPTVTINQASTQADPTNSTTIHFTAVFSEPVTGFTGTSVSLGGTAGAITAVVTDSGDHITYDVAVSGTTQDGTVTATVAAGVAQDAAGNLNTASTSTDNSVMLDTTAPAPPSTPVLSPDSDTGTVGDNITSDTAPFLTGTAEANSTVTVFDGTANLGTTPVDSSGNWTFISPTLDLGVHTITATATDAAGNVSAASGALTLTIIAPETTTPTPPSSESLSQRIVTQWYVDLLGRQPDDGGLAAWSALLDRGVPRTTVVLEIMACPEYLTAEVNGLYEQYLGRSADPDGLALDVGFLAAGGSIVGLEAAILGSPEYYNRAGASSAGFVSAVFNDAVGRPVDTPTATSLTSMVDAGASQAGIAIALLQSQEAITNLVRKDYQTYLHRAPDAGGEAAAVAYLQQGGDPNVLIATLVASDEFVSGV
jgi:hypothetical protein